MQPRMAISTLMALVIVASLQSLLAMEFLADRNHDVWTLATIVLVTLHAASLALFEWLRRDPVPGWRVVTASGVFLLAPQAAIRHLHPGCTFSPEGCGWVLLAWWLATAIAISAMLRIPFLSSLLTALAVCGATLVLASSLVFVLA